MLLLCILMIISYNIVVFLHFYLPWKVIANHFILHLTKDLFFAYVKMRFFKDEVENSS